MKVLLFFIVSQSWILHWKIYQNDEIEDRNRVILSQKNSLHFCQNVEKKSTGETEMLNFFLLSWWAILPKGNFNGFEKKAIKNCFVSCHPRIGQVFLRIWWLIVARTSFEVLKTFLENRECDNFKKLTIFVPSINGKSWQIWMND